MSADNWAVCPRCEADRWKALVLSEQALVDAYGQLPVEGYLAQRNAHASRVEAEPAHTFREDYEFWLEGWTLHISYAGECTVCHLEHVVRREETIRP